MPTVHPAPDEHKAPDTMAQPKATGATRRTLSLGLPRSSDPSERRFPITPEGARGLSDQGINVRLESGAATPIHYTDTQYAAAGAAITGRAEALAADIVIHLAPMTVTDIRRMRRGAMLITLSARRMQSKDTISELLRRGITTIALDLVEDNCGNTPFADILLEIDGRAAMARAASLLADADHGKGILLGGIAGIVPCEVTVIGSDLAAASAARSAIGLGAMVRMLDSDVYRLRAISRELGQGTVCGSLHPRALESALRTADVVVATEVSPALTIEQKLVEIMKRGVVIFDLSGRCGATFPSLTTIDLAASQPLDIAQRMGQTPRRVCYVNAGSLVPRTAAMAMSDAFITMTDSIAACEGITNALKILPGLRRAALTFAGKAVNPGVAAIAGTRHVDINIYLTLS